LPFAQKPRGEHRIENRGRRELMMFFQQAQIIIRRVKNKFVGVERIEQRIEIYLRERINQFVAIGDTDLDQADFFGIRVETIGFGVEREPSGGAEFRQQRGKFFVGVNHAKIILVIECRKGKRSAICILAKQLLLSNIRA
jgi:hypothetical protein